jgi:hypothetical protein
MYSLNYDFYDLFDLRDFEWLSKQSKTIVQTSDYL